MRLSYFLTLSNRAFLLSYFRVKETGNRTKAKTGIRTQVSIEIQENSIREGEPRTNVEFMRKN